MNPLEALKERLKRKPEVQFNPGVKVILAPPTEEQKIVGEKIVGEKIVGEDIIKPLITAEKDEGKRAKEILEKIKQKNNTKILFIKLKIACKYNNSHYVSNMKFIFLPN